MHGTYSAPPPELQGQAQANLKHWPQINMSQIAVRCKTLWALGKEHTGFQLVMDIAPISAVTIKQHDDLLVGSFRLHSSSLLLNQLHQFELRPGKTAGTGCTCQTLCLGVVVIHSAELKQSAARPATSKGDKDAFRFSEHQCLETIHCGLLNHLQPDNTNGLTFACPRTWEGWGNSALKTPQCESLTSSRQGDCSFFFSE